MSDEAPTLGGRETELMQVLWQLGRPATVADVHEQLAAAGSDLAYTTVQTMLNRLEDKGQVGRRRDGRAHRYYAVTPEQVVVDGVVGRLLHQFFKGSPVDLARHLIDDLDDGEIDRVQTLLERARQERER